MISASQIRVWVIFPLLLAGGVVVGVMLPFHQIRNTIASVFELQENDQEPDGHEPAEDLHLDVTETAQASLGLIIRRASLGNYTSTYDIPATLRTLPGADSIRLSSRFDGVVRRVFVSEGQSIRSGDPLMEIELTGESLSRTQSELLLAIRKNENLTAEIKRLEPLVQQGGLASKRYLELVYEQKQMLAVIEVRQQELLLLGLSEEQVRTIVADRKLIRSIFVRVPADLLPPQLNLTFEEGDAVSHSYILEALSAKPGMLVKVGQDLSMLAFHEILVVEGHAFERDLASIKELFSKGSSVSVSVGKLDEEETIKDCKVAYVGNHAREATNTFPFYVYLKNRAVSHSPPLKTPQYVSWKWKPGQLGHIELPKVEYKDMLVIPRDAVAEDGVSRMVFESKGIVEHDHEEEEEHDHEHAIEFVPVEVNVVFMDNDYAVIEPGGNLEEGTKIAFNCANQLLFTMQNGSGGHGHSHDHEH